MSIQRSRDLRLQRNATVEGTPQVDEDRNLDDRLANVIGSTTYDDLASDADIRFPSRTTRIRGTIGPSASGGACRTRDDQNWGAPGTPTSACWDYLPVIHASGDLRIDARGEGQGILLVDGDLTVTGAFDFYGLVVVKGSVIVRGGGTITGGLLVVNGQSGGGTSQLRNGSLVRYSSCALARSTGGLTAARPLSGRHWFEVP